MRLIHVFHAGSLRYWRQGWKVKTVDLSVGGGEEVVVEDDVHLSR